MRQTEAQVLVIAQALLTVPHHVWQFGVEVHFEGRVPDNGIRAPLRVLLVLSSARFRLSLCLPPVESESRGIRPLLHGLLHLLREHHHHLRQRPKLLHHLE